MYDRVNRGVSPVEEQKQAMEELGAILSCPLLSGVYKHHVSAPLICPDLGYAEVAEQANAHEIWTLRLGIMPWQRIAATDGEYDNALQGVGNVLRREACWRCRPLDGPRRAALAPGLAYAGRVRAGHQHAR